MRNQRGVTLIELLVAILIMVFVSSVVLYLFSYSLKMERTISIENELQREARFVLEQISNIVRDGGTVDNTTTPGEIVIKDKNDTEKLLYKNNKLYLKPGDSILSENVEAFNVISTTGSIDIHLVLKEGIYKYEVSTEAKNNMGERVRY